MRRRREEGQVVVLFALVIVALLTMLALVVDIGSQTNAKEKVRNAVDAAALAAAADLPATSANVASIVQTARTYASGNDADLTAPKVAVTFRCVVADANNDGVPDAGTVPGQCDQRPAVIQPFTCSGGRCTALCVPTEGDICNALIVSSSKNVPYRFAPVINARQGSTGTVNSAACRGSCGGAISVPMDIALVVDRTASMSSDDITNVKNASRAVLGYLDPAFHSVALGLIGPSSTSGTCASPNGGAYGNAASTGVWIAAPYNPITAPVTNYQNVDGTLNSSSQLVKTINCFNNPGGAGTDLGTPIAAAKTYFDAYGRPGVAKAIMLMTDGEATEPNSQSCKWARDKAAEAKAADIEIVTIGFGVAGATCNDASTPSPSPYQYAPVTHLLADMASPINGVAADDDLGCTEPENTDGDSFYCEPRTEDLSSVFVAAASQITGGMKPRLVNLS